MISEKIREDFPLLKKHPGLIYFDNAATSLKPQQVIDEVSRYYSEVSANSGRGSHRLAQRAGYEVEKSREEVAKFIKAKPGELVFTKNATESINVVAESLERAGKFKDGDEIVISILEHHANLIPWQQVCKRTGAKLKVVNLNDDFTLNMNDLEEKITRKTKMIAMAHASNTVATILPVEKISKIAHDNGALCLIDVAQSTPGIEVNSKKIGADFMAFSAHKMLGPTGIGGLYIKEEHIDKMEPYNYGGGIISKVTIEKSDWVKGPEKFEAGTKPIAEAMGFAAAAKYLSKIGIGKVREHEMQLVKYALKKMGEIKDLKTYCPNNAEKQTGIVLFGIDGIDAVDLGVVVDEVSKVAIRTGLHCAEPMVSSINPKGLARASFYLYNTLEEIDTFVDALTATSNSFK